MAVTITHTMVNSITPGALFQVMDTVTAASGIVTTAYVYAVDTSAYNRIASASDIQTYPNTRAAALLASQDYYLQNTVTKTFSALVDAQSFVTLINTKLKSLCVEYSALQAGFVGTVSATVSS